jgi:hypothetical protein
VLRWARISHSRGLAETIEFSEVATGAARCLFWDNREMARRTLNRRELRAAAEAAEAMGIPLEPEKRAPRAKAQPTKRAKPAAGPRMKVVWAVCDLGGRTVATFDYPRKADAEELIAQLKSRGKGAHFLRSLKEPMQSE